ncbi:MAG: adenine-specific methyltransferase EcoRI family protein [Elusimicrobiota bacterium]|jgi:hypothetical protein|nr:adenine-specific methyltransferase EcoRI family protein [Elusimicrobiota bacterium]
MQDFSISQKSQNATLRKAKAVKKDEFYTKIYDIENEVKHYKGHFRGKVVFCNCDDPTASDFWRYFHISFSHLGLKKLISTHFVYKDLFTPGSTYKMEYEGGNDVDYNIGEKTILKANGDFRSEECIEILKSADIVVTNPPFSLFREFVSQLMKFDKIFLIIGNKNAIAYKEIFPLIKETKVWLGYTSPNYYMVYENGKFLYDSDNLAGLTRWFTNLEVSKRDEELILFRKYYGNEGNYPKYDNYDAIEVSKVCNIPMDYDGVMGVPITFLDKYNPSQFEIVDGLNRYSILDVAGTNKLARKNHLYMTSINGKPIYARILIKKKQ